MTIGAFTIALSVAIFMLNWTYSKRKGPIAPNDPWDARTLEWTMPSPTPEWNFGTEPVVTGLDAFWTMKYDEDEDGRPVRKPDADEIVDRVIEANANPEHEIHLPAPSYFPFVAGLAIFTTAYGILYHTRPFGIPLIVLGVFGLIASFIAWGSEPLEEFHDEHDDDHSSDELVEVDE